MTIFISGGAKNGKSMEAQRLAKRLAGESGLFYVATMRPTDGEDLARIARHVEARDGWGFATIECPENLAQLARSPRPGSYLVDSVTALMANEMFRSDGNFDPEASGRVIGELKVFCAAVDHAVLVSDAICADGMRYDARTEIYREGLARVERALAQQAEVVLEACAGCYVVHKGELP